MCIRVRTKLPFRNVLAQGGVGHSGFGYTGEQVDPTDLVFLRARYYAPTVGRFITSDPIIPDPRGSQSWNRYLYVENNPIRFTDPSGYCPPSICRNADGTPADDYYRYGNRDVMNSLPLNGLNPWYPVDVVPPPVTTHQYPDGVSARISVSPAKSVPIAFVAPIGAFEALYNYHSKDITFFGIPGYGHKVGGGSTAEIVAVSKIYSIGNDNLSYAGDFNSIDINGAYVCGLSLGYSWVPNDRLDTPYSFSVGGVVGMGGQIQFSQTEYIPLFTVHSNGEVTTHTSQYLHDPATEGFITDYYRILYQSLQPYIQ